jgi:hypothetical protein
MKYAYWITTIIVCGIMGFSGYMDLTGGKEVVEGMKHLGYPEYFTPFLGVAKFLAVAVLLLPIFKTAKEWAYTGVIIDLVGAAYSHYKSGDGAKEIVTPIVFVVITIISYVIWKKITKQRLTL